MVNTEKIQTTWLALDIPDVLGSPSRIDALLWYFGQYQPEQRLLHWIFMLPT